MYKGHQGFVEWIDFLSTFKFREFTPVPISSPEEDCVIVRVEAYATVIAVGKESAKMRDLQEWKVKDGKIVSAKCGI